MTIRPLRRRRGALAAAAIAAAAAVVAGCAGTAPTPSGRGASADAGGAMTFFVTSRNPGRGGDLGGLAGADRHCQALASSVGAGRRTWRAYLSTQPVEGAVGVNARDRIGSGPWRNARGEVVATDVAQLHGPSNNLTKTTALDEHGHAVSGRGDPTNRHDVLTGSQPDGTYIRGDVNSTCMNWTQSDGGAAMVGHHDRIGLDESAPMKSWNSSHQSRGCSLPQLAQTGSAGLLYCFATN